MSEQDAVVIGRCVDDGGVRLEDPENEDAWLEADYREGWVQRKLMTTDDDAYAEMVEPYFLKCRSCHTHRAPIPWGKESPYCPHCEQQFDTGVPMAWAGIFDNEWETKDRISIHDV